VIHEQIEALNLELTGVLGNNLASAPQTALNAEPDAEPVKTRKKYKLSSEGRAKKVAAQKARWSKVKPVKTEPEREPVKTRKKSKFSAAGLARLKAAQKARWAKFHAAKAGETEIKPAKKVK